MPRNAYATAEIPEHASCLGETQAEKAADHKYLWIYEMVVNIWSEHNPRDDYQHTLGNSHKSNCCRMTNTLKIMTLLVLRPLPLRTIKIVGDPLSRRICLYHRSMSTQA